MAALPRGELSESPRWHDGRWWWVDVAAGIVHSARPSDDGWRVERLVTTGQRVSLVYPAGEQQVLLANGHRLEVWATGRGARPVVVAAELDVPPGFVLNDGVADAFGRLWIGLVAPHRSRQDGRLLGVHADGSVQIAVETFAVSNGLAVAPDGRRMFHADSGERVVYEHLVSRDGIERTRRYADFDDGMPDGLACDADGGVWVAVYGAGEVRRLDPSGRVDAVVSVPTPQVTSVALGGSDGCDMLITTAREGYDEARSAAEPLAGCLFRARVERLAAPVFPAFGERHAGAVSAPSSRRRRAEPPL